MDSVQTFSNLDFFALENYRVAEGCRDLRYPILPVSLKEQKRGKNKIYPSVLDPAARFHLPNA